MVSVRCMRKHLRLSFIGLCKVLGSVGFAHGINQWLKLYHCGQTSSNKGFLPQRQRQVSKFRHRYMCQ